MEFLTNELAGLVADDAKRLPAFRLDAPRLLLVPGLVSVVVRVQAEREFTRLLIDELDAPIARIQIGALEALLLRERLALRYWLGLSGAR